MIGLVFTQEKYFVALTRLVEGQVFVELGNAYDREKLWYCNETVRSGREVLEVQDQRRI